MAQRDRQSYTSQDVYLDLSSTYRLEAIDTHSGMAASETADKVGKWKTFESVDFTEDDIERYLDAYDSAPVNERLSEPTVEYTRLSIEQRAVLDICDQQLHNPNIHIRRVLVQGKAGGGKSAVIKSMRHKLSALGQPDCPIYEIPAPTGVAAVNVDGKTVHKSLRIPVRKSARETDPMPPLEGAQLRHLQDDFKDISFIIIDEYSMIGLRLFDKISQRLCEAKGKREPFGGCFVYLFGDINQLAPVNDLASYQAPMRDDDADRGFDLLKSIQKYIILRTCYRQGEDQRFRRVLDEIAEGDVQRRSWELLMSRRIDINREEMQSFETAVRLYPTNDEANIYNERRLDELKLPVAVIKAEHNNDTARKASSRDAKNLSSELRLSIGSRIMLRRNLCVRRGLVNGSLGTVRDIIYRNQVCPPNLPYVLMVEFDNFTGPFMRENMFPLRPVTNKWWDESVYCSRKQFPVHLSYALTIHKSQGLTLNKAVIDLGSGELFAGMTYVALSRVRSLNDLIIEKGFGESRLKNLEDIDERRTFLRRIEQYASWADQSNQISRTTMRSCMSS